MTNTPGQDCQIKFMLQELNRNHPMLSDSLTPSLVNIVKLTSKYVLVIKILREHGVRYIEHGRHEELPDGAPPCAHLQ
jgi:hypothetical protein